MPSFSLPIYVLDVDMTFEGVAVPPHLLWPLQARPHNAKTVANSRAFRSLPNCRRSRTTKTSYCTPQVRSNTNSQFVADPEHHPNLDLCAALFETLEL